MNTTDTTRVGIDKDGIVFAYQYANPTEKEISSFDAGKPLELRFLKVENIIFFMLKLGDMPIAEAPYNPHYFQNVPFPLEPISDDRDNLGYLFIATIYNTVSDEQLKNRAVGLGNKFSKNLYACIKDLWDMPFDMQTYNTTLQKIYSIYSTRQLWERATNRYKLKS